MHMKCNPLRISACYNDLKCIQNLTFEYKTLTPPVARKIRVIHSLLQNMHIASRSAVYLAGAVYGCFGAFFPSIHPNSPDSNVKFLFEVLENIITWQIESIHIEFFHFNRKKASYYCLSFIHSDTGLFVVSSSGFSALAKDTLTRGRREKGKANC